MKFTNVINDYDNITAFINVIKKDPQVCIKINNMLDRYRFCIYTYNCTYIIV